MILSDYHIHTIFCDGKNTAEEMVLKAINRGLVELGFSVHSWTSFDESPCIKKDKIEDYIKEINALKQKYKDRINILCGVEQDYYSTMDTKKFDYAIGSVHYLYKDGNYLCIDEKKEMLIDIVNNYYNGDFYSLCEEYFETVSNIPLKHKVDIIGHFDIITKYNKIKDLFDDNNERYVKAWQKAVDKLLFYNIPFEINTGGISRGHIDDTYPSSKIIEYIRKNNGKLILSSDSHRANTIANHFEKYYNLANIYKIHE